MVCLGCYIIVLFISIADISKSGQKAIEQKEICKDWPVIMFEDEEDTQKNREVSNIEIEAEKRMTLFGMYYGYDEEQAINQTEKSFYHRNYVRTEVYKCRFEQLMTPLLEKIKKPYKDWQPIEPERLRIYGVDEGVYTEDRREMCLVKGQFVINIKVHSNEETELLTDDKIKECIQKL